MHISNACNCLAGRQTGSLVIHDLLVCVKAMLPCSSILITSILVPCLASGYLEFPLYDLIWRVPVAAPMMFVKWVSCTVS